MEKGPICLFPVNKSTRSCGGNYPQLISQSETIPARTANNMQEIVSNIFTETRRVDGGSAVNTVDVNSVKGKP